MTGSGQERTSPVTSPMSALPPKEDIRDPTSICHIHSLQIARIARLSPARGSKIDGRRSERIGGGDFRERTRPGLTAIARFAGPEALNECIQCFVSMRPPLRH